MIFMNLNTHLTISLFSQINHQSITIMMGISYDQDLRVMSLVFEPFDYTLNHYLHQMVRE